MARCFITCRHRLGINGANMSRPVATEGKFLRAAVDVIERSGRPLPLGDIVARVNTALSTNLQSTFKNEDLNEILRRSPKIEPVQGRKTSTWAIRTPDQSTSNSKSAQVQPFVIRAQLCNCSIARVSCSLQRVHRHQPFFSLYVAPHR